MKTLPDLQQENVDLQKMVADKDDIISGQEKSLQEKDKLLQAKEKRIRILEEYILSLQQKQFGSSSEKQDVIQRSWYLPKQKITLTQKCQIKLENSYTKYQ